METISEEAKKPLADNRRIKKNVREINYKEIPIVGMLLKEEKKIGK